MKTTIKTVRTAVGSKMVAKTAQELRSEVMASAHRHFKAIVNMTQDWSRKTAAFAAKVWSECLSKAWKNACRMKTEYIYQDVQVAVVDYDDRDKAEIAAFYSGGSKSNGSNYTGD